MGTWVGPKKVAVIPCIAKHPGIPAPPADFQANVQRRIFFDPDPATGIDRSLRRYLHTASYGRAVLVADVLDPVTITWHQNPSHSDPTIDAQIYDSHREAIALAGAVVANYEFVMVVFPAVTGVNFMRSWAFFADKTSYMFLDNPIGAWAMELLHITTQFGDLYGPPANRPLSPGNLDEMDTSGAMHPSTFTKLSIGWLDASTVKGVDLQQGASTQTLHSLALLQPPPPGRSTALKLPFGDRANHYYLIESREWLDDYDRNTPRLAEGIPLEGVVVYDVDESIWPPLWLKAQGLGVGQSYVDDAKRFRINVTDRMLGGGYKLTLLPLPAPQRCIEIPQEISNLQAEIRDLQAQLHEAGADKPGILRQIRELQAQISALQQESAKLNCGLWASRRMGPLASPSTSSTG